MFKNMKLSLKISALATILILFGVIVNITGYSALQSVATASKTLEKLNSISKLILEARRHEKNYILRKNPTYIQKVQQVTDKMQSITRELQKTQKTNSKLAQNFASISQGIDAYWKQFSNYATLDKEKEKQLDAIVQNKANFFSTLYPILETTIKTTPTQAVHINNLASTFNTLDMTAQSYITASQRDNFDKAANMADILNSVAVSGQKLQGIIKEQAAQIPQMSKLSPLLAECNKAFKAFDQTNKAQEDINKKMVLAGRQAQKACDTAQAEQTQTLQNTVRKSNMFMMGIMLIASVSGGLMSYFLITGITRPIRIIIDEIAKGSQQTTQAAGEVSVSAQQLSQGATEQAASLEETSSSLDQITSMVKQNADNTQHATSLSQQAKQDALEGNSSMVEMNKAMEEIQTSSGQIASIIKSIEAIAFQTNLLALNAAVEAARAGEHGKGFAVVAEEVRNLAKRSADAAKNTTQLIDTSLEKVNQGNKKTKEVTQALDSIQQNVLKTADIVEEIATANKEQADGISQINKAINQMDTITQTTAATAEESASVSEELSAQAQSLASAVRQLQMLIEGAGTTFEQAV